MKFKAPMRRKKNKSNATEEDTAAAQAEVSPEVAETAQENTKEEAQQETKVPDTKLEEESKPETAVPEAVLAPEGQEAVEETPEATAESTGNPGYC
jgi:hypothetical protein